METPLISSHLPNGTLLQGGKYRIEGVLGQGGFGITYRATNMAFDEPMAIKEFFMKGVNDRGGDHTTVSVSNHDNENLFGEQIAKFRKEARRIRKLHNPHIVAVHDLFDENGTAYYVMDYVEGESLTERLERVGHALPEVEVRGILNQLLEALVVVHGQGFWHLDVEPGNVLMDNNNLLRLIDFGASKQMKLDGGATTNTQAAYTKGYAPLEQVSQRLENVGAWTDLYAAGALCYKLLTDGQLPEAYDLLLNGDSVFEFPDGVSEEMQSLIKWMMKPNHKDRPQSVAELQARLSPVNPVPVKEQEPERLDAEVTVIASNESQRKTAEPEPSSHVMQPDQYDDEVHGDVPPVWNAETFKQQFEAEKAEDLKLKQQNTVRLIMSNMVTIQGGTFVMGCRSGRDGTGFNDEYPAHEVTLSSFQLCRFQVTQREWEAIMGQNRSKFKGEMLPVVNVSWHDCHQFIQRLNEISGQQFRLPTEAEWEYAARGGQKSMGTLYSGSDILDQVAWYARNSDHQGPHPVGHKSPNELDLYDMTGNVHEWCQDETYSYKSTPETNPCHEGVGGRRVTRGGCWLNGIGFMRISQRNYDSEAMRTSTIGLRLAMSI